MGLIVAKASGYDHVRVHAQCVLVNGARPPGEQRGGRVRLDDVVL